MKNLSEFDVWLRNPSIIYAFLLHKNECVCVCVCVCLCSDVVSQAQHIAFMQALAKKKEEDIQFVEERVI